MTKKFVFTDAGKRGKMNVAEAEAVGEALVSIMTKITFHGLLIEELKDNTACNNHMRNYLYIADKLNDQELISDFKLVHAFHMEYGHKPPYGTPLRTLFEFAYVRMKELGKAQVTNWKEVYQAL
jgi:hypothetical protein